MDDIFSLDLQTYSTTIPSVSKSKKVKSTSSQEIIDLVSDVSDDDNESLSQGPSYSSKQPISKESNTTKRTLVDDTFDLGLDIGTSQSFSRISSPKRHKTGNEVRVNNGISLFGSKQNIPTPPQVEQPVIEKLPDKVDPNDPQACLENLSKLASAYERLQSLLLRKVERMSNSKSVEEMPDLPDSTVHTASVDEEPTFDTHDAQLSPSFNNNNTFSDVSKPLKRRGRPPKNEKAKLKEEKPITDKPKEERPKIKLEKIKPEPRHRPEHHLRPRRAKEATQSKQSGFVRAGTLFRNTSAISSFDLNAEQERSIYRIGQLDQEAVYLKLDSATLSDGTQEPLFYDGPKSNMRQTMLDRVLQASSDALKKDLAATLPEIWNAMFSNKNQEFCKYLISPRQSILRPFVSDQVIHQVVQFMKGNRNPVASPAQSDPNHKYVHTKDYGLHTLADGDVIHVPFSPNEVDIIDEYLASKNSEHLRNDNNNNDNNRVNDFGFVQLSDEQLCHVTSLLPGRTMQDVSRYIYGVVYQSLKGKTFNEKNIIVFRKVPPRYNGNLVQSISDQPATQTQTTGSNYFTLLKEREYMSLTRRSTRKHQHLSIGELVSQYSMQSQSQMAGGPIVTCKFNTHAPYHTKKSVAVCSAQAPNELVLYDILSGEHKVLQGHEDTVSRIEFSHCGEYLISGGFDKAIRVWNAQSGDLCHTFEPFNQENSVKGHNGPVELLALHNTSHNIIATAAGDKSLFLWDIEKLEYVAELTEPDAAEYVVVGSAINTSRVLLDMTFCHGEYSHVLLAGCETEEANQGKIKLWDTNQQTVMGIINTNHEGPISSVYAALTGKTYYSGSNDSTARIFDFRTNKEQAVCKIWKPESVHKVDINLLSLSPCERYLQASCTDNRVYVFDQRFTKKPMHVLCHDALDNFSSDSQGVATAEWSKSGLLVTGGEDSRVRVWDVTQGQAELTVFGNHNNTVSAVAISPEEDCIISGGDESKVLLYSFSKLYKLSK